MNSILRATGLLCPFLLYLCYELQSAREDHGDEFFKIVAVLVGALESL